MLELRIRGVIDALGEGPAWPLVARLTAVYVLAYLVAEVLGSLGVPAVQAGLVAAGGAVLLWPRLAEHSWPWWAMTALMACALWPNWMLVDNHVFLATYWLLAVAVARSAPEEQRDRSLALAASSLVGLTMLFAAVHKLRTPEFVSGDFFHLTFLSEPRFSSLGWVVGEDLGQITAVNAERLGALVGDPTHGPIALRTGGSAIAQLARATSAAVVAIEALLAVLWVVHSEGARGRLARHSALLAFAVATYAIAPVPGFGAILLILGLADTRPGDGALRASYLVVLLHVLFGAALLRAALA